tara:strand:+ start:65 stop:1468 length:1404 start_codon:yes stop_codon:yes gene_type:complete
VGYAALENNLTGTDNTAVGYSALKATTGTENTALGSNALDEVVGGSYNTAVGSLAMGNADGDEDENTAIGRCALFGLDSDSADGNIAIGHRAGQYYETDPSGAPTPDGTLTQAINSIYIGTESAGKHATSADNEIAIGYKAVGNGADSFTLGNAMTASLHCAVTSISSLSDRRIKRDVKPADNVGLAFIEKLNAVEYKKINPADWPEEIRSNQFKDKERQELVTPAVKAEPAVWAEAVEEVTKEITIPAVDAVYDDIIIPAQEAITEEREKFDEVEISEEVEKVEMIKGEGNEYIRKVTTETVTRTERTPLYEEHPVVNEDGTPCLDAAGNQVIHLCPVRETVVVQEAQPERTERKLLTPAQPETTETVVVVSAKERRLVKPAIEAAEAVYKTVTVPADERPEDNDTNYVGLIAQDVQTAMTEAGVDFDLVDEGVSGKLAVKYSNLVIPLLKSVQELKLEIDQLKNA